MKVSELIEHLQTLDKDLPILSCSLNDVHEGKEITKENFSVFPCKDPITEELKGDCLVFSAISPTQTIVIEHPESDVWFVSFNGINPTEEESVQMFSEKDAYSLQKILLS